MRILLIFFMAVLFSGAIHARQPQLTNRTWLPVPDNVQETVVFSDALRDRVHPRLFFREEDVPELRERANRSPFREMVPIMERFALREIEQMNGYQYGHQARVRAFLYVLTGDQKWADLARESVEALRSAEDRLAVWYTKTTRQLNLTQGSLSVALAYDWCYHVWPADYRAEISRELSRQGRMQIHDWGRGFPSQGHGNNWRGIRFAGAGIAFLASDEPIQEVSAMVGLPEDPMNPFNRSPGLDPRWLQVSYDQVAGYLTAGLTASPDARGVNAEGQGYMMYPWRLVAPFLLAARTNLQVDVRRDVPATRFNLWQIAYNAVKIPSNPSDEVSDIINYGLKPDFTNDSPHYLERGELALAFDFVEETFLPGFRWHWDQFFGAEGTGLYGVDDAGIIWAYLFYPEQTEPVPAAENWGLGFIDPYAGKVFLRNDFAGENDILVALTARSRGVLRQTHFGADIASLRIFGEGGFFTTGAGRTTDQEGQSIVVNEASLEEGVTARGEGILEYVRILPDGSGTLSIKGSAAAVTAHRRMVLSDFSPDAEGLSAFLILADESEDGDLWQLNIPGMNEVELGPRNFTITAPNGARLQGLVHSPANPTLELTTYERRGGVHFHGRDYEHNHRLLLRGRNGETRFLVTFQLLAPGASRVTEELERTQPQPVFKVGERRYAVMEDRILVSDWSREASVQAEVSPAGSGRVVGRTGNIGFGEKVEWEAIPANGYRFVGWESPRPALGQPIGTHPKTSFRVADDTQVKAVFARQ